MRSIEARLAKLETGNRGAAIVVWCDDPADVEITVSAMIADGQISGADRERLLLVHWVTAAWAPSSHDGALGGVDTYRIHRMMAARVTAA